VENLSFFCRCGAIFKKICKNIENCLNNDRKMTKNGNASRKMQFLQPAKLSCCLSCFSHLVENLSFFVVVVQFSPKYEKILNID